MSDRPVSSAFIKAMEEGLEHGRKMGQTGWDTAWKRWLGSPSTLQQVRMGLLDKLDEEVEELLDALRQKKEPEEVLREAADVANLAMMLADLRYEEWEPED